MRLIKLNIKYYIAITLLSFVVCCKDKQTENSSMYGHILLIHNGEEDKPIPPFILHTMNDSSYLKYEALSNTYRYRTFIETYGLREINIEEISSTSYLILKSIILKYNTNKEQEVCGEKGTFDIVLSDQQDSLIYTIPKGMIAKSFFLELKQAAKDNKLSKKAILRLAYYSEMQNTEGVTSEIRID